MVYGSGFSVLGRRHLLHLFHRQDIIGAYLSPANSNTKTGSDSNGQVLKSTPQKLLVNMNLSCRNFHRFNSFNLNQFSYKIKTVK